MILVVHISIHSQVVLLAVVVGRAAEVIIIFFFCTAGIESWLLIRLVVMKECYSDSYVEVYNKRSRVLGKRTG